MLLVIRVDDDPYLVIDVVVPSHVEGSIPRISVLALGTRRRCAGTCDGSCGDRSYDVRFHLRSSNGSREDDSIFPIYSTFCALCTGLILLSPNK